MRLVFLPLLLERVTVISFKAYIIMMEGELLLAVSGVWNFGAG